MGDPIVHFEITGKDGAGLQKFYSKLFGWKVDASNPVSYGLVDTGSNGRGIAGGIASSQDGKSSATFYIEVKDINAKLKELEKSGGKIVTPVTTVPGMVTFALFTDPAGNVIGLVDAKMPD